MMQSIPEKERVMMGSDLNRDVAEGRGGDKEVMRMHRKKKRYEEQIIVNFAKRI